MKPYQVKRAMEDALDAGHRLDAKVLSNGGLVLAKGTVDQLGGELEVIARGPATALELEFNGHAIQLPFQSPPQNLVVGGTAHIQFPHA